MKRNLLDLTRRYQAALRRHLKLGRASAEPVRGLGCEALAAGCKMLDLAKLHEQTVALELLPVGPAAKRAVLIKRAGIFFATAITPSKQMQRDQRADALRSKEFIETLSRRTVELAASNLELGREIAQREAAEEMLKKSERHTAQLLEKSDRLQEQSRRLARQILTAQEDERKKISRELHDVIAQTLTGINVRLATLKKEAALNARSLERNIASMERLVEKSVNLVHRFARELRPAVLDDLGLIPALHTFMKCFTARTGVRARLSAFAAVEHLDPARRMVLFRVAQEALTNVDRHAQASRVEVSIEQLPDGICMRIIDDGRSFPVQRVLLARGGRCLGLLGMRERLEMVGGRFGVESAPGKGTTITARLPAGKTAPGKRTRRGDRTQETR